jgi:hypothetical protein
LLINKNTNNSKHKPITPNCYLGLNCSYGGQTSFGQRCFISQYFLIFRIFIPNASQNKLCMSTNFIILGATDQKLWMFEVFRTSLGKADMCCSQPARVDHMCKKRRVDGIYKKIVHGEVRAPVRGQRATSGRPPAATLSQTVPKFY